MALLKTSARRISGFLPSHMWTTASLGCSCSSMLHGWAPEGLKDMVLFIWKDYSENIHTKEPKTVSILQDLPSQKSSMCGDLSPCSLLDVGMARRRPGSTSTNKVKNLCQVMSVVAKHLGACTADIQRPGPLWHGPPGSQGSSLSPVPHASEGVGTVNGFRHLIQVLVFPWYREVTQSRSIAWLVIQRSKHVLK